MPRLQSLTLVLLFGAVHVLGHTTVGADFPIPDSKQTVDVKMLSALSAPVPGGILWAANPDVATAAYTPIAGYAFLIEHAKSRRRVLFDLGIRKDTQNLSPTAVKEYTGPDGKLIFNVGQDVPDQLVAGKVPLASIDTVIWSHSHFDHIGDMSKLPNSTRLLVGPGTLANALPGYPADPNSLNLASDFVGHNITEVVWDGVKIAGQKTHDLFGDGSLFLLDMPGHIEGHIAALARVTVNPTTFILLAGDTGHHPALMRPAPGVPLPHSCVHALPPDLQKFGAPEYSDPFVLPAPQNVSVHQDAVAAQTSLAKAQRFDARADTWVIVSHDGSLRTAAPGAKHADKDAITLFPASISDWARRGWKESSKFGFLDAQNPANIFVNATAAGASA